MTGRRHKRNPKMPQGLDTLFQFLNNLENGFSHESYFDDPPAETERVFVECSIPPAMFRKLLMLCHPDKHGNSELSQEVTRWLIAERGKRK